MLGRFQRVYDAIPCVSATVRPGALILLCSNRVKIKVELIFPKYLLATSPGLTQSTD